MLIQAGSCSVRLLHWTQGRPDEVAQDQLRYALGDHLGSSSLELDAGAALISHETFHPFGSSAWWVARSEVEARYKTVRYSGKERDASGLYYYGARYYRADWQRWLNPDPAAEVDGLNLYCMVSNAPINRRDLQGQQGFDVLDDTETGLTGSENVLVASGLTAFSEHSREVTAASLCLGRQWVEATRTALQGRGDQDHLTSALSTAFGSGAPASAEEEMRLRARLSLKLKRAGDYLGELQGAASWRLMLVEFDNPVIHGATYVSLRGARVALSPRAIEAGVMSVAATLLHESMHAMDRYPGKFSTSHEVRDYRYMVPGPIDAQIEEHLEWALNIEFSRYSLEAPSEAGMSSVNQAFYRTLVNRVGWRLGLPSADTPQQRGEYYQQVPEVRQEVELHNADFLTGVAMMFHRFIR